MPRYIATCCCAISAHTRVCKKPIESLSKTYRLVVVYYLPEKETAFFATQQPRSKIFLKKKKAVLQHAHLIFNFFLVFFYKSGSFYLITDFFTKINDNSRSLLDHSKDAIQNWFDICCHLGFHYFRCLYVHYVICFLHSKNFTCFGFQRQDGRYGCCVQVLKRRKLSFTALELFATV